MTCSVINWRIIPMYGKSSPNPRLEDRIAAFRAEFTFPIIKIARRVFHVPVNYVHPKVQLALIKIKYMSIIK